MEQDRAGGAIGERYTATVSRAQADLTPVIVAIIGHRHALTRQNDERDMGDNDRSDNDGNPQQTQRKWRPDVFGVPSMERDMDRMVERAIESLVERGKMTPEEAIATRERAAITPRPITLIENKDEEGT